MTTTKHETERQEQEATAIRIPAIRIPEKYTIGGIVLAVIVAAIPTLQGGATKAEVSALNTNVSALSTSVSTLQANVAALTTNVAVMQATIEKLRDERSQTDKALANIEARLAAVERELSRQHDVKRQ